MFAQFLRLFRRNKHVRTRCAYLATLANCKRSSEYNENLVASRWPVEFIREQRKQEIAFEQTNKMCNIKKIGFIFLKSRYETHFQVQFSAVFKIIVESS